MNILDIYQQYKIMPQLAEHQLKVAAVAEMICDNWKRGNTRNLTRNDAEAFLSIDRGNIITACLLHDMGNIIKFNLNVTQKLYPDIADEELAGWRLIQEEFIKKYGSNEHEAAITIARELGAGEKAVELIDCIGFNTGQINAESSDYARKVCAYSDMRVGPGGVISLEERLADLRARYDQKFHQMGGNEQERLSFENGLRAIEQQLFLHTDITPAAITEHAVEERKEQLKKFEI